MQAVQDEKRAALEEADGARTAAATARDELSKLQGRFDREVKAALEKRAEKVAQLEQANATLQHQVSLASWHLLLRELQKRKVPKVGRG